jgi:hypothetical protein
MSTSSLRIASDATGELVLECPPSLVAEALGYSKTGLFAPGDIALIVAMFG